MIKTQIENYYQGSVKVLDTSEIVAKYLKKYLVENDAQNPLNAHIKHFYVSDFTQSFETSTKIFFGEQIRLEYYPLWE